MTGRWGLVIGFSGIFCSLSVTAQTLIKVEEVAQHIGDSVKIITTIYGGRYFGKSQGTPTLLNAGAAYPKSPLTLYISAAVRNKFASAPEEIFEGKEVVIFGRIIMFKDRAEIVVYGVQQILLGKQAKVYFLGLSVNCSKIC